MHIHRMIAHNDLTLSEGDTANDLIGVMIDMSALCCQIKYKITYIKLGGIVCTLPR